MRKMSITESASYDESNFSECSEESTLSSELDYELHFDVLLPDNSVHKTSVPAYTPWSDLKTRLLSQFKLSPSSHTVDFVSSAPVTKKRRSSAAVGKMKINMITIKQVTHHGKRAPPPPRPPINANIEQGSVRLIVRMPKQRQSILRVNPDLPLSNIFDNVTEKLKMNEEIKSDVEFRHPQKHHVKLNSNHSLNHYNLREIYLAEKHEPRSPTPLPVAPPRAKRKAPARPRPPRPPPPVFSSRSKSTSSAETSDNTKETAEPIYAKVQKKPKPIRRRTAPLPPVNDEDQQDQENPQNHSSAPTTTPEPKPRASVIKRKEFSANELAVLKDRSDDATRELSIDETYGYAIIEGVRNTNEDSPDAEDAVKCIDEVLESDANEEAEEVVNSIDDVLQQLDDVKLNNVIDSGSEMESCDGSSAKLETKSHVSNDSNENDIDLLSAPPQQSEVIKHPRSDDAEHAPTPDLRHYSGEAHLDLFPPSPPPQSLLCDPDPDDDIQSPSDQSNFNANQSLPDSPPTDDRLHGKSDDVIIFNDVIDDDVTCSDSNVIKSKDSAKAETVAATNGEEIVQANDVKKPDVAESGDAKKTDDGESEESLPLNDKPEDGKQDDGVTDVDASVNPDGNMETNAVMKTNHSVGVDDALKTATTDDGFDLHIAESFNISPMSIDEMSAANKINIDRKPQNNKGDLINEQNSSSVKQAVKSRDECDRNAKSHDETTESRGKNDDTTKSRDENEETIKEIEKLHKQIKQMRKRSTGKQKAEVSQNSWHPGSKSFTFVPNKGEKVSHVDYDVEPVGGIQLSNNGEIETLHREEKSQEEKLPAAPSEVLKHRSSLPNYYKKFLGAHAFADKQSR